jgi:mannose-1-phosphate guanylyltransferase/mannose-6-phosphate isomerase
MLIPIILSGGVGSRLWPLSRQAKPKHFMPLIDDNILDKNYSNKSLLQQTVIRCSVNSRNINNPFTNNPVLVCSKEHRFLVADQCLESNIQPEAILLEPERKDTAAAIMLAVFYINKKYPDANILVSPSDHYMSDIDYYLDRINDAIEYCNDGRVITFGIHPTYPETGYGYIEADFKKKFPKEAYFVNKFIEKPNYETAEQLIKSGNYFWNSGIFMFNIKTILNICKKLQPDLYKLCENTVNSAKHNQDFVYFDNQYFDKINPISIDYALMQDVVDMTVLKYLGQWSDVGCWRGVWENSPKDTYNNVVMGQVIHDQTSNCYLRSDSRLIVTLGVDNLSIIETPDAVLVTKLENSQHLRHVVESSMANNRKEFIDHSHVHRPWGEFIVLSDDNGYKVKKLIIKPDASLSLQSHKYRDEHWVVVQGTAEIIKNDEVLVLNKNDTISIPCGTKHRITNRTSEILIIIEIQTGNYLSEDDIIRYHDIYGRDKSDYNSIECTLINNGKSLSDKSKKYRNGDI